MQIGVTFPQTEIGSDPGAVREYAQAAESLGFKHILAYDHVVGANPSSHPNLTGPSTPFMSRSFFLDSLPQSLKTWSWRPES